MADERIKQKIAENALGPEAAEADGVRVKQHPLKDQIEADRYLKSQEAMQKKSLGIKLTKIVPSGTQ